VLLVCILCAYGLGAIFDELFLPDDYLLEAAKKTITKNGGIIISIPGVTYILLFTCKLSKMKDVLNPMSGGMEPKRRMMSQSAHSQEGCYMRCAL
jgi:hypothetical protein